MIVDCLNLAFRWKHNGDLVFLDSYRKTVDSLRQSYKAGNVILATDGGSSSYRRSIYPDYKGNRQELREKQTEEEAMEFKLFLDEFSRTMRSYEEDSQYPLLKFPGVEADDIAGFIVKYHAKYKIDKIVLVSSDRDWDTLLVKEYISRWSYNTRKTVSLENWSEHYACTQEEYISVKCLQGDSGDNVPGVPGIGIKRACALVSEYGSTYDIANSLPLNSRYQYIKNLNAFGAEALLLNYQLMDIIEFCDEAIGSDNCKYIENTLQEYIGER